MRHKATGDRLLTGVGLSMALFGSVLLLRGTAAAEPQPPAPAVVVNGPVMTAKESRLPPTSERIAAAKGLGQLPPGEARVQIRRYLKDPEPAVRRLALAALSADEDPTAVFEMAELSGDPSVEVRSDALTYLSQRGDELGIGAVARFLDDPEPAVRHRALDFLGETHTEGSLQYVASVFAHEDPTMRKDAIRWLEQAAFGMYRDQTALWLLPFLGDPEADLRLVAVAAIGETGDPVLVEQVARFYQEERPELRLAAVASLKKVWDPSAADALVAYTEDVEADVRKSSYQGLASLGGRSGFALLVDRGLEDPVPEVRQEVIRQVADLRLGTAVEPLVGRLESCGDLEERKLIIEALARIGTPEAQVALYQMNAQGTMIDQLLVAKIWSDVRQQRRDELEALRQSMEETQQRDPVQIEVSVPDDLGAWDPEKAPPARKKRVSAP